MSVLDPIKEFLRWVLEKGFRLALRKAANLPLIIAQSAKLMRMVTLTGMSLLSLALLGVTVHIVRTYGTVQENEALANSIELHINAKLSNAVKVAEATEWLVKSKRLGGSPENNVEVVRTLPWIKSSEIAGMALISDRGYSVMYGSLDQSYNAPEWERIRWDQLRNRTASELKEANEPVTVFLGIERLFRTEQEINQGRQLTGALILARAWKNEENGWDGVVILLPAQSFNSLMRLGPEQYNSGDYDYLVDNDGFLLAHPRPYLIYGTDRNGRELRGASNSREAGKFPINTRDSDWIAGSDVINRAFGLMLNHQPTTVAYKNLQNQTRLTSFRLVELGAIKGKSFGIVVGRGLSYFDSITTPLLLRISTTLFSTLWVIAGIYLILLTGWLACVSKFRSLHLDLLAWSRFMNPDTASKLGLIPIPKGELKDYPPLRNIVAIVITVGLNNQKRKAQGYTLELLAGLSTKLQDEGWVTHIWSFQSLVACRPFAEPLGGKLYFWSPANVVDHLRDLKDVQLFQLPVESSSAVSYRVVYGIGDLHIKAGRLGPMQQATISLFGNLILETVRSDQELSTCELSDGALMYPIEEAHEAGIQILGDRITVNSRIYAKLPLGKKLN
ncbi:MAG TPA: cache domain-containing protein [Pyrinomonadaceae bacterium]|jgi:hypothetical protein